MWTFTDNLRICPKIVDRDKFFVETYKISEMSRHVPPGTFSMRIMDAELQNIPARTTLKHIMKTSTSKLGKSERAGEQASKQASEQERERTQERQERLGRESGSREGESERANELTDERRVKRQRERHLPRDLADPQGTRHVTPSKLYHTLGLQSDITP